jgi:hypothetical protein
VEKYFFRAKFVVFRNDMPAGFLPKAPNAITLPDA